LGKNPGKEAWEGGRKRERKSKREEQKISAMRGTPVMSRKMTGEKGKKHMQNTKKM